MGNKKLRNEIEQLRESVAIKTAVNDGLQTSASEIRERHERRISALKAIIEEQNNEIAELNASLRVYRELIIEAMKGSL